MESDAGRDANKSFGYWAGLVTLRETENLKNKVRFYEYPLLYFCGGIGIHTDFKGQG